MFREFNVKFEDVEMLGGADNLLEGTEITKVIVRGDNNKMSSLDSMLKNCNELDTVDGELDLNGVGDIDNLLEGTELVKSIDLKNINNENISANNSFPHIEQINIGGELYNKKAMQNVIASKDWTFDNITYNGTVGDNVVTKEVNIIDDNKATIQDTLEQKAKGIEIIGQTYENLVDGKSEHKLTNDFSTTWTITNNSIDNPPSMIEIPEIWGNTVQDESDLNIIQSVGDLYVDESGEPILDEEGNEQYKLEIESNDNVNILDYELGYDIGLYNDDGTFNTTQTRERTGKHYVPVKEGRKYIFYKGDGVQFGQWFKIYAFDNEKNFIGRLSNVHATSIFYYTIPKGRNIKYIKICITDIWDTPHIIEDGKTIKFYGSGKGLSNKTTILMPQPLRKVGDFCDKLYWDYERNKYILEVNVDPYSEVSTSSFSIQTQTDNYITMYQHINNYPKIKSTTVLCNTLPSIKNFNATEVGVYGANAVIYFTLRKSELTSYDVLGFKEWFTNNPSYLVGALRNPQTVETKILDKLSLETYSPKTYISTNTEIQPSQMNINNKETIFIPKFLDSNKKYTVKFNCTKKGDKPITVNLGGNVLDVNATLGENIAEITTSQTVDKKELVLSGNGNIVTDVFVIADNMSTGELQDGGTYKIDINTTDNINHYSISIIANNSLAKGDKLYWNKSNKRYEIDRNGDIEVPTVSGDIIDLPRLYQRENTNFTIETGNIKPSKTSINYLDID